MLLNELKNPVSKINAVGEFNLSRVQRVMFEAARRSLAGMWFALAAVVPVAYNFLAAPLLGGSPAPLDGSLVLTAAVPIVVFGICGAALGAGILDATVTKSAVQAVERGLMIAGLSYLLLFLKLSLVLAGSIDDLIILIILEVIVFLYGLLFIGWLLAAVGAAAGGLLYLCRVKWSGI